MKNLFPFIKIFSLLALLISIFFLKSYLSEPNLKSYFDSLSFKSTASSSKTSSSAARFSSLNDNEQSNERFDLWLTQLQMSTAVVDQIAKVIYEKDAEKNLAALKTLRAADPQNSLINYLLIQACLTQVDVVQCGKDSFQSLQTFESDNGVVRDLEFLDFYRKGDLPQALATLNEANHSPYTNDFTYAKFSALAQLMENFGFKRDLHMFESIEGVLAAGVANHLNTISSICKERQGQVEWQGACYARGQSLAERSRDSYSKMIGIDLMKRFGGDSDPAYIKIRNQFDGELKAASHYSRLEPMAAKGWAPSDLQWQEFLTLYEAQGDRAAKRYFEHLLLQK